MSAVPGSYLEPDSLGGFELSSALLQDGVLRGRAHQLQRKVLLPISAQSCAVCAQAMHTRPQTYSTAPLHGGARQTFLGLNAPLVLTAPKRLN